MSRATPVRITHKQFFSACETMKKNREWFITERPSLVDAAKKLSELCGFQVSPASAGEIKETTNLVWSSRIIRARGNSSPHSIRSNLSRTLTVSLYRLYRKLGEEIPGNLQQAYDLVRGVVSTEEKLVEVGAED
jgi:hypothetical protein